MEGGLNSRAAHRACAITLMTGEPVPAKVRQKRTLAHRLGADTPLNARGRCKRTFFAALSVPATLNIAEVSV